MTFPLSADLRFPRRAPSAREAVRWMASASVGDPVGDAVALQMDATREAGLLSAPPRPEQVDDIVTDPLQRRRFDCSACGREALAVTADGRFRAHGWEDGSGYCTGSHRVPDDVLLYPSKRFRSLLEARS